MPIYVYVCNGCEKILEELRPMADMDKETYCPVCHSKMTRQLTVPSFTGEKWEMHAIKTSGDRVKGRFGRTDQLKGRVKS